ncbi:hypothetical protein HYW42_04400 [Candidatus Daviesbacteria bacterium]|nr:hypothetical protein [Candidatus Daviesbacteria bacterium]
MAQTHLAPEPVHPQKRPAPQLQWSPPHGSSNPRLGSQQVSLGGYGGFIDSSVPTQCKKFAQRLLPPPAQLKPHPAVPGLLMFPQVPHVPLLLQQSPSVHWLSELQHAPAPLPVAAKPSQGLLPPPPPPPPDPQSLLQLEAFSPLYPSHIPSPQTAQQSPPVQPDGGFGFVGWAQAVVPVVGVTQALLQLEVW